ncbi:hypothetical protein [Anaerovorax odorimutans]|uniref:hypothetical protein n=1 Tax=Anaerovorax odorimutans TaxID=109327 RepID=UPI0004258337|nr:hypothetical protein [Anaerovorax odorimutans]
MRIYNNCFQSNNTFFNVNSINRKFDNNNSNLDNVNSNSSNKDRVSLTPQGKMMSMIQDLTKQKESIIEKKNNLVNKTIENGGDMDDIKDQIKIYNDLLDSINEQIDDIYAKQTKEAVTQDDEKKSNNNNLSENKTEDQLETEHLSNLANLTEDIKQAKKISAAKSKVEGETRVKESEINMGEIHIDILESKGLDGETKVEDMIANEKRALDEKRELISDLQDKALQLNQNQGKNLNDVIESLEENIKSDNNNEESDNIKPLEQVTILNTELSEEKEDLGKIVEA